MRRALPSFVVTVVAIGSTGCLSEYDQFVDETRVPAARITTTAGDVVARLDSDAAPETVAFFAERAAVGSYDGTVIHRVEPDAILHAGAWRSSLTAKEPNAPIVNESDNGLSNARGTIAMARSDAPSSATSQFFVNLRDNPDLDGGEAPTGYAVFGHVTSGMDVVDEIGALPTTLRDGYTDVPVELVTITHVARLDAADTSPTINIITSRGSFIIELAHEAAPVTVENFLAYVDSGFYAGTVFHRVVADFVIQGGGVELSLENTSETTSIANEAEDELNNTRGTLAMIPAASGAGISTEFVFNLADNPQYDASAGTNHRTVFGSVIEGLEILDEIAAGETVTRDGLTEFPAQEVRIEGIELFELPSGHFALTPAGEAYLVEWQYGALVSLREATVVGLSIPFTR